MSSVVVVAQVNDASITSIRDLGERREIVERKESVGGRAYQW